MYSDFFDFPFWNGGVYQVIQHQASQLNLAAQIWYLRGTAFCEGHWLWCAKWDRLLACSEVSHIVAAPHASSVRGALIGVTMVTSR